MDNIIKNPTFIAVVAGVLTYTYIVWKKKQNTKNNKKDDKKNKKNNTNEMVISGIVTVIVWFIVYGYINYNKSPSQVNVQQAPQNVPTYKLVQDISDSPKSFTLINPVGGIAFPTGNAQMPDLFIDNF
jgi:heme/copper-type cytochrome/quinol oxidase subunit 2